MAKVAERIARRVRRKFDVLVLATGGTGTGKSTLVMRTAEMVAKKLDVDDYDPSSVILYTPLEIIQFYRDAVETGIRGKIGIYDEGARGLLSTETVTPEQRALVQAFQLVREAGCVLFICVPSMMTIAKAMRVRLAHMWLAVERRGMARVHLRDMSIKYAPETNWGFSVWAECPQMTWKPYPESAGIWTRYQSKKHAQLLSYLKEIEALLQEGAADRTADTDSVFNQVQALRRQHPDWTQIQLAKALGVKQGTISKLYSRHGGWTSGAPEEDIPEGDARNNDLLSEKPDDTVAPAPTRNRE